MCARGQTAQGIHCNSAFAPVVAWMTIQFVLILSLVHKWHMRQIDFVLAHPQAKVSHTLHMHAPKKFKVQDGKLALDPEALLTFKQPHKLKLLQNLHGTKGRWSDMVWPPKRWPS